MRRIRSCARAASGHAIADAVAALMNSRRRTVAPDASGKEHRTNTLTWSGRGQCPLWANSGHHRSIPGRFCSFALALYEPHFVPVT